jgi:hypothetical protein
MISLQNEIDAYRSELGSRARADPLPTECKRLRSLVYGAIGIQESKRWSATRPLGRVAESVPAYGKLVSLSYRFLHIFPFSSQARNVQTDR